jgi:type I restriction enzyme S subunit
VKRVRVKLAQVAIIVGGSTPDTNNESYWGGDIYWATPKDLSNLNSQFINATDRKITSAGLASCSSAILPTGSVLFSSRAPIGLVAINSVPMATNQGFKSFIPQPDQLDAKYLYHWLVYNRARINAMGVGATFKEVSKKVVADIEISLPPLSEQKRIAAILDKADEIREKRERATAKLDQLSQSLFIDMFGDPESNSMAWDNSIRLGDVSEIVSGITKGRKVNGMPTRKSDPMFERIEQDPRYKAFLRKMNLPE